MPALSGSGVRSPWASGVEDVAVRELELALGSYVGGGRVFACHLLLDGDQRELADTVVLS